MDPPLQFQGESNHHAKAEVIDKTGVLFAERICATENLAEIGKIFCFCGMALYLTNPSGSNGPRTRLPR
jgi:hypothetical protein